MPGEEVNETKPDYQATWVVRPHGNGVVTNPVIELHVDHVFIDLPQAHAWGNVGCPRQIRFQRPVVPPGPWRDDPTLVPIASSWNRFADPGSLADCRVLGLHDGTGGDVMTFIFPNGTDLEQPLQTWTEQSAVPGYFGPVPIDF